MSDNVPATVPKKWTAEHIPDQTGKVIVVTGANSGLGLETSREMARRGAQVIMACRTASKAEAAIADIKSDVPDAKLTFMPLDLASLESVRSFAEAFTEQHTKLDILCNNAGVMALPYSKTADGFEMQFGTNHIGHFALTGLLLDTLLATPQSRIVNVSSLAHVPGKIKFKDINHTKFYNKWLAYCQSKLANLLFTYELHRKLQARGSDTLCVASHPGYTSTNLQLAASQMKGSKFWERIWAMLNGTFAQSTPAGAWTNLYACTAPHIESGDFVGPKGLFELRGHPGKTKSTKRSRNKEDAKRLWDYSVEQTGVAYSALND
ncbi:MAG: SDR family NAD(P)-dependent oxidoreductase [Deltaproteobacteria bacterium]|nr:MAG: SDR family NAD(P)-dependent oxidoreductase [Deltaproteobacteria bacterium]